MNQDYTTSEYIVACVKRRILKKIADAKAKDAAYYEEHKFHSSDYDEKVQILTGVLMDFTIVECNLVLDDEAEEVDP